MEQLQVLNFDPAKVVAHPRVLAWHDQCVPESMYIDEDIKAGEDDEMDDNDAMAAYYMI